MVPRYLKWRVGAVALAWLAFANPALAADVPKLVVVPFTQGEGAPERAGARFATLVSEELKTREDDLQVVIGPALKAASSPSPASPAKSGKPAPEATAALADGKRALADLKFEEAVTSLKKGIEASLADPATADYASVYDGYISLAVAYFRQGEEKPAQAALFSVARLSAEYKLAEGKFPPVFLREYDKAKKRAAKASKAGISIEGPAGSTAFVDGRDLGMVPVLEENLPVGPHYVKVEGTRGERFGQAVDLKGGVARVKAAYGGAPAVSGSGHGVSEPRITAVLDADTAARIAGYVRAAGADYALVGIISRSSDHQLTAATALYSARRQGFGTLSAFAVDHELLTANVEAFKLADEVTRKVESFGAPVGLPLTLTAERAVKVAVVNPRPVDVDVNVPTGPRLALRPGEAPDGGSNIRAFARSSTLDDDGNRLLGNPDEVVDAGPVVGKGTPAWVWIVVGVGVAAAAGGTYYGVSEASRPVTGTVTATW
ncbi:MAG: peptidase associated/transthyretin-like domain-containing protein [Myxococcaceae bacterium]